MCYIDSFMTVLCKYLIRYIPNIIIPDISLNVKLHTDKELQIDNFQYDNIEITKKIKILLWLLWDDKETGRLFLLKYLKFIGTCSMIFIDYHIKKTKNNIDQSNNPKINRIKKIISVDSNNKLKYITPNQTIDIPFGEIIFDTIDHVKSI